MNFLPKDLEDIIVDYKNQMEHNIKFQSTLDEINKIEYKINNHGDTWRTHDNVTTQYYGGLNHAETLYHSDYELWVHTYIDTDDTPEEEVIKVIFESIDYTTIEDCS